MKVLLALSILKSLQTSLSRPYERFDAKDPRILMAEMTGMTGESMGMIAIHFDGINDLDMSIDYNLHGLDSNSTCNIAIYTSVECHNLGRHLFKGRNINNPWRRTKVVMDENGKCSSKSKNGSLKPIQIPQGNRMVLDENNGHAIIVYNQKASLRGIPIVLACGKLRKIKDTSNKPSLPLERVELEQDL
ncbi:predicted protein [Chaetoceros tenuissimus]|uniref:Uncharacterized protein n=1 Tax=Chaetoceros tenuissimus TaxID=426638 RepID=A0AAD3DCJ6_9STRA|nr:predicted protein [Chaetoceros tenuissimus]